MCGCTRSIHVSMLVYVQYVCTLFMEQNVHPILFAIFREYVTFIQCISGFLHEQVTSVLF